MVRNRKATSRSVSSFAVEFEREDDGRWIAEIPKLKGVMAYGMSKQHALQKISELVYTQQTFL
jgi:predicted RNase H-like HicB family nuclease